MDLGTHRYHYCANGVFPLFLNQGEELSIKHALPALMILMLP
jgi:hypothetical protein